MPYPTTEKVYALLPMTNADIGWIVSLEDKQSSPKEIYFTRKPIMYNNHQARSSVLAKASPEPRYP